MVAKRRKVAEPVDDGRPESVPLSLAVELWTTIFEYVHEYSMVPLKDTPGRKASPGTVYRRMQPNKRNDDLRLNYLPGFEKVEDRRPPVQFSYHLHDLRLVCKIWKDVIESMPEFCSRLVIFIGSNTTPLARIRNQIQKSANCFLDVTVRTSGKISREEEMKASHAIMKILTPIVPRCRTFVFDVEHSSSLPVISRDFRGNAPYLRVLKLECNINDGDQTPFYGARPKIPEGEEFKCPSLTTLAMDGNTFMDACFASWTKQLKSMYLDSFSIFGLCPPNPDDVDDGDYFDEFDILAFSDQLTSIGFIRHLTLHDINVAYDEGYEDRGGRRWDNLTVIGNDKVMWDQFLSLTYTVTPFCYYHLSGTGLEYYSVPAAHHLRLENIHEWNSNAFDYAFKRHGGSVLDIVDCKHLDDTNLEQIMLNCLNLRRLSLIKCPRITIKGLKNMIKVRNKLVEQNKESKSNFSRNKIICAEDYDEQVNDVWDDDWAEGSFTKLDELRLEQVSCALTLSKVDREWFKQNVKHFSWK